MNKAPEHSNIERVRVPTEVDVIDRVLDKGIVVEYKVTRVLLCGIDIAMTVDARIIIASCDTYLKYAEPLGKTALLGDKWPMPAAIPADSSNRRNS